MGVSAEISLTMLKKLSIIKDKCSGKPPLPLEENKQDLLA